MASCDICVEKFNKSTRLPVKCNYCEFVNCRTCFQKYLLETQDPYCMGCKKIFTRDFISENCTNVFVVGEYKKHREDVLLDREKSLMAATQVYVVLEKEKEKVRDQIKQVQNERAKIYEQANNLTLVINQLGTNIRTMTVDNLGGGGRAASTDRKKFIRKCPMDNCRGFLSQQWKCGICDTKICNKCNEEKVNDHVCNEENVASMELLNRDTKPCPECGTMIFRISGCSQMFCIECHCAWNWNTGLVERGIIHNPHYYDFIRRGGNTARNHGDIPCGGLPELYVFRGEINVLLNNKVITNNQSELLYNIHNCITHIQHYEIRDVPVINEQTTRDLRIQYMLQKISEETFKGSLQELEKNSVKRRDFNNIYQMFIDVASDIYRQLSLKYREHYRHRLLHDTPTLYAFFKENIDILVNLKNYFNDNIKKVGNTYKCVYPGICDNFRFQSNYKTYLGRLAAADAVRAIPV